jgi:HAD superfamily hydrolase (TIGR01549 family)
MIQGKIELLPGAKLLLDNLAEANIPQAIGSSAPQENIDAIIDSLGLRPYFKAIVSAADMPGKPDPSVFLAAAEILNIPPDRCLVIEDALAGVAAAKRAGMKCLAITTTNPPEKLARADRIVHSFATVSVSDLAALMN